MNSDDFDGGPARIDLEAVLDSLGTRTTEITFVPRAMTTFETRSTRCLIPSAEHHRGQLPREDIRGAGARWSRRWRSRECPTRTMCSGPRGHVVLPRSWWCRQWPTARGTDRAFCATFGRRTGRHSRCLLGAVGFALSERPGMDAGGGAREQFGADVDEPAEECLSLFEPPLPASHVVGDGSGEFAAVAFGGAQVLGQHPEFVVLHGLLALLDGERRQLAGA